MCCWCDLCEFVLLFCAYIDMWVWVWLRVPWLAASGPLNGWGRAGLPWPSCNVRRPNGRGALPAGTRARTIKVLGSGVAGRRLMECLQRRRGARRGGWGLAGEAAGPRGLGQTGASRQVERRPRPLLTTPRCARKASGGAVGGGGVHLGVRVPMRQPCNVGSSLHAGGRNRSGLPLPTTTEVPNPCGPAGTLGSQPWVSHQSHARLQMLLELAVPPRSAGRPGWQGARGSGVCAQNSERAISGCRGLFRVIGPADHTILGENASALGLLFQARPGSESATGYPQGRAGLECGSECEGPSEPAFARG